MPEEKNEEKVPEIINDVSLQRIYANFILPARTATEFNLTFCCIDPFDIKAESSSARAVAKIVIPISIVEDTLKKIMEEFNNPKKPNSGVFFGQSKDPVY